LGCAANAVGTITVKPLQNASFNYSPATVCKLAGSADPTVSLTGTPSGTFSCANAGLIVNPTSGTIDLQVSALGTYTVTYTTAGPCPNSSTATINIVSTPKADFTFATYCKNDPSNPIPTYINGGTAGTFTAATGVVFADAFGKINLSTSAIGTFTVTNAINSPGCPATTFTNSITINPVPVTKVNSTTVCAGTSATLTASGANTYTWAAFPAGPTLTDAPPATKSYSVTGTSLGCSSAATATITVNPIPTVTVNSATICAGNKDTLIANGAMSYVWSSGKVGNTLIDSATTATNYTVTGTSNGCTANAVAKITVNPKPIVTVNSPAICQGLSGNLTASGANTFIWIAPGGVFYVGNPYTISPTTQGSYTVVGSTSNCNALPTTTAAEQQAFRTCFASGCASVAYSNVTIIQKPVIVVNSPTICIGQTANLLASGAATYSWSTGANGNMLSVTPSTTTSYTVSDNTAGCSGASVSKVTVNPLPVVTVNASTICAGQTASLAASGALNYKWSNGTSTNPLITTLQNNGSYTVTGTSAAGCIGNAITNVVVNPLPIVTVTAASICEGFTTTLTANGAISYLWSTNAITNPLTVSPTLTTQYSVTGTDAKGCTAKATNKVTVFPKPVANFNASPQPAFASSPFIAFTDKSSIDVNYWHWNFGDGDTLGNKIPNPTHTYPTVEATYTVTLNVLNAGLCPNSITHQIVLGPEYSFFIPNAFSPNGDGTNDTFFGKGKGIIQYELMIFDRWGNFIFYADDINKGWDGKANGGAAIAQQDTYVWKVNLTDIFNKKHSFIGTVVLLDGL
jgi:gliding motility-associated-like protein